MNAANSSANPPLTLGRLLAGRSFFFNAADNRYTIEHSGQLWGLLATITINKVRTQAAFHNAQK